MGCAPTLVLGMLAAHSARHRDARQDNHPPSVQPSDLQPVTHTQTTCRVSSPQLPPCDWTLTFIRVNSTDFLPGSDTLKIKQLPRAQGLTFAFWIRSVPGSGIARSRGAEDGYLQTPALSPAPALRIPGVHFPGWAGVKGASPRLDLHLLVTGHELMESFKDTAKNVLFSLSHWPRPPASCVSSQDDVMMPQRVRLQHQAAVQHPSSIVGCQVRRDPPNSTERYTRWINQLTPEQLLTQGVPEDLLFFYEHLRKGGGVIRVDQSLLLYRYHPRAATHSVLETTVWTHRVRFLEEQALPRWAAFTIWNAGKQGRRLYRSLTAASQRKVVAFCDVDENKIRKGFYCHEDSQERPKPRIPILHFRAARPPFVICVKLACGSPTRATLSVPLFQQHAHSTSPRLLVVILAIPQTVIVCVTVTCSVTTISGRRYEMVNLIDKCECSDGSAGWLSLPASHPPAHHSSGLPIP
ncbi:PREDICTED: UDP-GlcNAc:betaGal beta-1,3-N-acetylglucosaminyltransferase-like protein 1 isoform X3 [Cercocebus atys]|uniref:UDP-GlcNAc:betaGal beta-1,3-N-acetylglucosaminyltransferase-like protein 1 isoform X3 n=1 Tax=Cercocebus atys TaxID=9531 RepID=UPI0005F540E5|nr:PREDICTED: UDP-GlcNAc:betaGal beta-1,3-N-acetylglucosaminyltransferase-like protein 1 isoform X3 [Cercocebus atys]